MVYKKYIDIVIRENKNGEIVPLYFIWEDGKPYRIDRIISKEHKSSIAGGGGLCFLCIIHGQRRNIFLEKNRWFLECQK